MRLADVIAAAALKLGFGAAPGGTVEVKTERPKSRMPSATQQIVYYGFAKRRCSRATSKRMAAKRRNVLRHRRACRG